MWGEVLNLFQKENGTIQAKISEIDPEDYEELLMEVMGKRFTLGILTERMAMNTDLDPDIKGLHSEIAEDFKTKTDENLPYTTLQKVLRDPTDQNIRPIKRLAVLGYLLLYMGRNVTDFDIGYSLHNLNDHFKEKTKENFFSILK